MLSLERFGHVCGSLRFGVGSVRFMVMHSHINKGEKCRIAWQIHGQTKDEVNQGNCRRLEMKLTANRGTAFVTEHQKSM